jgi:ATP-dependent DNA ligase
MVAAASFRRRRGGARAKLNACSVPLGRKRGCASHRAPKTWGSRRWLARAGAGLDGVTAQRLKGPYALAVRAVVKIKHMRTADCGVGLPLPTGPLSGRSLVLGLSDAAGKLDRVGFTSTITDAERPALTRKLKTLAGFTGKAPGAPSQRSDGRCSEWTPLKSEPVVEVRYDQKRRSNH